MKRIKVLFVMLSLLVGSAAFAQTLTVSGVVTDA